MSYCTIEDVKKQTRVKAEKFGYKNNPEDFDTLIQEWITQSEGLINSYCKKDFNEKTPSAVKNVCIRLVSNMIAFYHARKDDPIKKVNDFSIKIFSSEVFTTDLKEDLKPFRKAKKIAVFNI